MKRKGVRRIETREVKKECWACEEELVCDMEATGLSQRKEKRCSATDARKLLFLQVLL